MAACGSHLVVLVHEAILKEDFVKINHLRDYLLDILQDLRSRHPVTDYGYLDYHKLLQSGSLKRHLGIQCLLPPPAKEQQKLIALR